MSEPTNRILKYVGSPEGSFMVISPTNDEAFAPKRITVGKKITSPAHSDAKAVKKVAPIRSAPPLTPAT